MLDEVVVVAAAAAAAAEATDEDLLLSDPEAKKILTPPETARNSTEDSNEAIEGEEMSSGEVVDEEEPTSVTDENRVPSIEGEEEEEELIDVGKNCDERAASPCSLSSHLGLSLSPSLTVASAVGSDKARQRAISSAIEAYVEARGGNLYPSREEKDLTALELGVTFNQVNRWFANRRRKVTKHRKILGCTSPLNKNIRSVNSKKEKMEQSKLFDELEPIEKRGNVDECIEAIIEESRRKRKAEEELDLEMVASHTEALAADAAAYAQDPSELPPPPGASATAAMLAAMITHGAGSQLSPYLLASLMSSPAVTAQLLQQVMQQQQLMTQLHQQQVAVAAAAAANSAALASPHHHHQQLSSSSSAAAAAAVAESTSTYTSHGQQSFMSPPVTESPMEELSEHSDYSPRCASPRFKDPHNIADPAMAKLLAATDLSEKESIAIAVLTEMRYATY